VDQSELLAELERRFPSLGTDDENVDMGDQWDALVQWHRELAGPGYQVKPADCPLCGEFVGNGGVCPDCTCTACGRDSLDCSRNPCAQVRADRGERGAVSLPLLTFQACAAIGLASALWSVYLRLVAQLGGFGL
jgi:hypothetical protein